MREANPSFLKIRFNVKLFLIVQHNNSVQHLEEIVRGLRILVEMSGSQIIFRGKSSLSSSFELYKVKPLYVPCDRNSKKRNDDCITIAPRIFPRWLGFVQFGFKWTKSSTREGGRTLDMERDMIIDWTADTLPSLYSFRIFDSFSLRSICLHALTATCTLSLSSVPN